MKTIFPSSSRTGFRRAFTLVELMVAGTISCLMAGSIVFLLLQSVTEQRHGFADMSVEEKSYILQANLATCLRSMSANQGLTPDYSSALHDAYGNVLGYQSVYIFTPTNGGYVMGNINYTPATGAVVYIPNVSAPGAQTVWMSNGPTAALTEFCMSTSFNLDGSQNSSLVNVIFQMNDNGFSQQNAVNNPASIYRNFSVQMRNDN